MADVPGWASHSVNPRRRFRIGRKILILLVTSCAIITWTGWNYWDTAIVTSARLKIWNTFDVANSIRLLKSTGAAPEERLNAAANLRTVEADDEIGEAIATLIAALNDENTQVRITTVQSLGALVSRSRSDNQKNPVTAERMNKWSEAGTRALLNGLSDEDPDFRAAVCTAIQTTGSGVFTDEVPPRELVAALNDESVVVCRAAVQALVRFPRGLDSVIPHLISMLEDSDPALRRAAALPLAEAWPTSVVVPRLIVALSSQNRAVRSYSARMLGRIGPAASAAVPLLRAILKEPIDPAPIPRMDFIGSHLIDPIPSHEAAIALGRVAPDESTIDVFIDILSNREPDKPGIRELWMRIAEALCAIGPQASKAVPALIVALNKLLDSKKEIPDPYPIVDAIGRCSRRLADSAAVVSALIRLLDPEHRPYTASRACIVEILGRFGRAAAPAIPKLKSLQGDNNLPNYTRVAAAKLVAAIQADPKIDPSGADSR